ncbi:MAG TPA: hypothetical protein QGF01_05310 [Candidatus Nitrosopelagicus sp.]|jgi:hypothetical protein|nr:hypothetical protein [Candidatus Nitrosopelagicus sp.]
MAFPYKPKPNHSIQKKFFLGGGICGLIILAIFVIYTAFPSPTAFDDHSIMVDPTVEKQSLFTIARVTIQNTGTSQLTNLTINYGDNDIDSIGTLDPGKTIILSPPQGNSLQYVIVTADGDVHIFKAYREPVAMPGMMGS